MFLLFLFHIHIFLKEKHIDLKCLNEAIHFEKSFKTFLLIYQHSMLNSYFKFSALLGNASHEIHEEHPPQRPPFLLLLAVYHRSKISTTGDYRKEMWGSAGQRHTFQGVAIQHSGITRAGACGNLHPISECPDCCRIDKKNKVWSRFVVTLKLW